MKLLTKIGKFEAIKATARLLYILYKLKLISFEFYDLKINELTIIGINITKED